MLARDDAPSPRELAFIQAFPFARRAAQVRSAIATMYSGSFFDREDLEQEALIGVWLGLRRFDANRSSLRTFVEHIVKTKVASAIRRTRAAKRMKKLPPPWTTPENVAFFMKIDFQITLMRALQTLPPGDRVIARLLTEYSPTEISRILRIPRAAIYRSIDRIRVGLVRQGFK